MELRGGQVVALQGRSGSGKSTLLALLAGWCGPDEGALRRAGHLAEDGRWATWSGTAIVPQVLGLAEELSVAENLEHVLRLGGVARAARERRVEEVLDALDLAAQRHRLPRETSLGQQQRVAVGRAVIAAPVLLLADEPTCHQDPAHAAAVLAVLRAWPAAAVPSSSPATTPPSPRQPIGSCHSTTDRYCPAMHEGQIVASGLAFPEGPVWHDGSVWFTEITGGRISRLTPQGDVVKVADTGGGPNGAALGRTARCGSRRTAGWAPGRGSPRGSSG